MNLTNYVGALSSLNNADFLDYAAIDIKNMVHDLYSPDDITTKEYSEDNLRLQGVAVYAFMTDLGKHFDEEETTTIINNDLNGLCANIAVRRMATEQGFEYMMSASDAQLYGTFIGTQQALLKSSIKEIQKGLTSFELGNKLGNEYPVAKALV